MITAQHILLLSAVAIGCAVLLERLWRHRRHREFAADAPQVETQLSAALLRVARELLSCVDTPEILQRLCHVTTKVLGCDWSHCLVWDVDKAAYVPRAAYGETPEQWAITALLEFPRAAISDVLTRLKTEDVVHMAASPTQTADALPTQYGKAATLYVALRRGQHIVGLLTAGYRDPEASFVAQQERIAAGIASIASLALANANLVEALARTNRSQAEFVSRMVHELRTPLSIITGYNDLLLDGAFGQPTLEQCEVLRRVSESAQELLQVIQVTRERVRPEGADGQDALKVRVH